MEPAGLVPQEIAQRLLQVESDDCRAQGPYACLKIAVRGAAVFDRGDADAMSDESNPHKGKRTTKDFKRPSRRSSRRAVNYGQEAEEEEEDEDDADDDLDNAMLEDGEGGDYAPTRGGRRKRRRT
eukprot:SAG11_NODE_875_length_6768_cov_2.183686_7_plen_125_part_00